MITIKKGTDTHVIWDETKDRGGCVFNHLRECIAKIPEACLCGKMDALLYKEIVRRLERGGS